MGSKARRPAKIASAKKGQQAAKVCPITGKPMTPVKVFGASIPSGMYWVVLEDFDGGETAIKRMIPTR